MIIPAPELAGARVTAPMLDEALRLCLRQVLVRRNAAVCRWRLASVGRCKWPDWDGPGGGGIIRFAFETTDSSE